MATQELKEGMSAPDFELPASSGKPCRLADLKGKWVVLYFYPKDNTPGCTRQACAFREAKPRLTKKNAVVLGVSKDSLSSHERFSRKHDLNFTLLSDSEGKVCDLYDIFKQKTLYGRTFLGIERSTFLINPEGKIQKIWRRVVVEGHEEEVLKLIP